MRPESRQGWTIGIAVAGGIVAAFVVIAVLLAWGHDQAQKEAANDSAFLRLTAYDDTLSLGTVDQQIELGHQMCDLLGKYHGDDRRAGAELARGYESTFTPRVLEDLRSAATLTYCPKYA